MFSADILRKNDIIGKLSESTVNRLYELFAPCSYTRRVPAGYVIIDDGDIPREVVFLVSGSVISNAVSIEGNERVGAYTRQKFSILTLFLPLLTQTAHFSRLTTRSASTLAFVPADVFLTAMDELQEFYRAVSECVFRRAVDSTQYNYILRLKGAKNRVGSFLLFTCSRQRGFVYESPYSMSELASYLNLARPTVSREIHSLERAGIIKLSGRTIELLEPEGLKKMLNM